MNFFGFRESDKDVNEVNTGVGDTIYTAASGSTFPSPLSQPTKHPTFGGTYSGVGTVTYKDDPSYNYIKKIIKNFDAIYTNPNKSNVLIDKDLIDIIELYLSINNETLLNERYNIVNASTEHPSMKASTSIMEQKKIAHIFINVNTVLFIMICTLIYIQTNIPGYISKHIAYFSCSRIINFFQISI